MTVESSGVSTKQLEVSTKTRMLTRGTHPVALVSVSGGCRCAVWDESEPSKGRRNCENGEKRFWKDEKSATLCGREKGPLSELGAVWRRPSETRGSCGANFREKSPDWRKLGQSVLPPGTGKRWSGVFLPLLVGIETYSSEWEWRVG